MPEPASGLDASSDVFLRVEGPGGLIRGEATTDGHTNEIEVRSWQWGVSSGSAIGSGASTARRTYRHLVVCKGVDSASTPLVASLVNNASLSEVKLTMRKAGGEALDYFQVVLGQARVIDVDVQVDSGGRPQERVTFSFGRISLEYTPQQSAGAGGGATCFEDEVMRS